MSELTLDQIEQRLSELPAAEREAWLDHICKRFGVTKPETVIVRRIEYAPQVYPCPERSVPWYPQPAYPDFPGSSPWGPQITWTNTAPGERVS